MTMILTRFGSRSAKLTPILQQQHQHHQKIQHGLFKCANLVTTSICHGGGDGNGDGRNTRNLNLNSKKLRKKGTIEDTIIIMYQDGFDIQEVPWTIFPSSVDSSGSIDVFDGGHQKTYTNIDQNEEASFIEGFNNFHTPKEVLKLLDLIPSSDVTPKVSISILKKLFELESNSFEAKGRPWYKLRNVENNSGNFARMAIVSRLIDIVISSDDSNILLQALDILKRDRDQNEQNEKNIHPETIQELDDYRNKLCQEILIRITHQGKSTSPLSLEDICRAIISLGKMNNFPNLQSLIDKLWVGILDNKDKINCENISLCFRTVPYFEQSQKVVIGILEKLLLNFYWNLNVENLAQICQVLSQKYSKGSNKYESLFSSPSSYQKQQQYSLKWRISNRTLNILARCACLNIHAISEVQLDYVVKAFIEMNFTNESFEKALSKYMKTKCLKVQHPNLVANVMNFVNIFQIRSPEIFDAVAEYTILHKADFSPQQLSSILIPYGTLSYLPQNGLSFWLYVEQVLQKKFMEFTPREIIDILLSFTYIQKFPLNFVDRVFTSYFLDRLHSSDKDYSVILSIRSKIKLLDTALTIENRKKYNGPLLPKDFSGKSLMRIDGRILRTSRMLEEPLREIFKNVQIETNVLIPQLPCQELYLFDIIVSKRETVSDHFISDTFRNKFAKFGLRNLSEELKLRQTTSILIINIPEHYCSDGKLIGSQLMRKRHFQLLGFKVINLSYEKIWDLYRVNYSQKSEVSHKNLLISLRKMLELEEK